MQVWISLWLTLVSLEGAPPKVNLFENRSPGFYQHWYPRFHHWFNQNHFNWKNALTDKENQFIDRVFSKIQNPVYRDSEGWKWRNILYEQHITSESLTSSVLWVGAMDNVATNESAMRMARSWGHIHTSLKPRLLGWDFKNNLRRVAERRTLTELEDWPNLSSFQKKQLAKKGWRSSGLLLASYNSAQQLVKSSILLFPITEQPPESALTPVILTSVHWVLENQTERILILDKVGPAYLPPEAREPFLTHLKEFAVYPFAVILSPAGKTVLMLP